MIKERDNEMGNIDKIEIEFYELKKKYERSKNVIEGFKKNEEVMRKSLEDYEEKIRKKEKKYEMMK
jgi:hypothetical protein